MKKLIFTLVLLSAPLFIIAQGLGVGIKAGANFSNLSTDQDGVNTEGITTYHVGLYANINFSEKWGVVPEVLWSAQGAEFNAVKLKTDYVLVPILLRWRVIELISIEAGPQFNILTNAESAGQDVKDELESTTYSLAIGATCHLPLGFNGGIRYLAGMSDLAKSDAFKVKDQTFQVYVGWTIFGAK